MIADLADSKGVRQPCQQQCQWATRLVHCTAVATNAVKWVEVSITAATTADIHHAVDSPEAACPGQECCTLHVPVLLLPFQCSSLSLSPLLQASTASTALDQPGGTAQHKWQVSVQPSMYPTCVLRRQRRSRVWRLRVFGGQTFGLSFPLQPPELPVQLQFISGSKPLLRKPSPGFALHLSLV